MEVYDQAAVRHYKDAESLRDIKRRDNSDQLIGLSAECALKVALSHSVSKGALATVPTLHINELWAKALLQIEAKRFPTLIQILKGVNAFGDWQIDQRYERDGFVTEAALESHRKAARRILGSVGLLPS